MERPSLGQRSDFRALADHLEGVAIWVVVDHGEFEYISAGFEDIWGIPPEAVEDDVPRLIESFHPDDRDRVRSFIEQSRGEVSEEAYEARVVRPDGTVRWVHARQFPLRDDAGNLTTIVGVSVDITEQKRREQELEALNRIVRHDIRNDMSVVLGWAELLEEHVDEEGRERLQKVLTAGEHIVELTETAGDYVESVVSQTDVTVKPTPLRPALKNEVELRRESHPDAEFVLVDGIPAVEVRANEILPSVFRNLLNNAVQHSHRVDPVVEVSCEVGDDDVLVRVADNGPGIPDDRKESIFGESVRGVESAGSGIGLYLVRTLVEQYGGRVWVEDNEPTGAVFTVRLPRA